MKGRGTGRYRIFGGASSEASSTEFVGAVGGRAAAESGDLCFQPVAIYKRRIRVLFHLVVRGEPLQIEIGGIGLPSFRAEHWARGR